MINATCCHPSVSNDQLGRRLIFITSGKALVTFEIIGGCVFYQSYAALKRRFNYSRSAIAAEREKSNKQSPAYMPVFETIFNILRHRMFLFPSCLSKNTPVISSHSVIRL